MKETITNPNQPNQIPDEWQELSDEAKPFKEHVKRSHQEKLQRFMELSGVKESRKNEQQFEESLSHLNRDRAYNYLSHINGIQPDIYLTEDAEQNLTDKEKNMVNRVFMDGDIATVSLGYVLTEKGTYDEVADNCTHSNGDEQFVTLEVTKDDVDHEGVPNEDAHKTFEGWTADDYRNLIKTNSWVQKWQYDRLIDFFKTPEEYKVDDNTTVAKYLTGEQN